MPGPAPLGQTRCTPTTPTYATDGGEGDRPQITDVRRTPAGRHIILLSTEDHERRSATQADELRALLDAD